MHAVMFLTALVLGLAGCSSAPSLVAPSELTANLVAGGNHLTWKDNSPDEAEFEIERRLDSASFARLGAVAFDLTQFHDDSATDPGTYVYRVRAIAGSRSSAYSNEASVQVTGDKGDGGPDVPDGGTGVDGAASPVSFRRDIAPMFQRSCGANTMGCHTREAYAAAKGMDCRGWLALEDVALGARFYSGPKVGQATGCPDRSLYERLTQLDAWMCEGPRKRYIASGATQNSQIYQAVAGDPSGGGTCNKQPGVPLGRMPPPPAIPPDAAALQRLAQWIRDGAPNN